MVYILDYVIHMGSIGFYWLNMQDVCLPHFAMHLLVETGTMSFYRFSPPLPLWSGGYNQHFPHRNSSSFIFLLVIDNLLRILAVLLLFYVPTSRKLDSSPGKIPHFSGHAKYLQCSGVTCGRQWTGQRYGLAQDLTCQQWATVSATRDVNKWATAAVL